MTRLFSFLRRAGCDVHDERGMALLSAVMVMMLVSALAAGFVATVMSDQQAGGVNRDQTQAYAAAHAGLEKLTADLGDLFVGGNYSPDGPTLAALESAPPAVPGFLYEGPGGSSGYRVEMQPTVTRQIPSGPYQGLIGLVTPYAITVTARSLSGGEVRMRREMQTVGIPVFQFGIFSENDLSFFAGPDFNFGGRVHTNENLFLKQDGTALLTLSDRVTAVGEVIRARLANGQSSHSGRVRVTLDPGTALYRELGSQNCVLAACEGSVVDGPDSALNEPLWTNLSVGTYNRTITNGRTGARRLDLPLVSDGAAPIDLIRRPDRFNPDSPSVFQQRFFSMASLRILLSDTSDDLMGLPTVNDGVAPISLEHLTAVAAVGGGDGLQTRAAAVGVPYAGPPLALAGTGGDYRSPAGTSLLGGFIKIQRQGNDGSWHDVTYEILNLGFAGRRLSRSNASGIGLANRPAPFGGFCPEPNPDAVVRLQRLKDTAACASASAQDHWPTALYDAREGARRDNEAQSGAAPRFGGVMHYVELDVNNLRRWLEGEIGSTGADDTMDETGYVVYFSDRRGNRTRGADGVATPLGGGLGDDQESGEFGMEDNISPASVMSARNGNLDPGEDVNGNGVIDDYGDEPRSAVPINFPGYGPTLDLWTAFSASGSAQPNVARANRAVFFRRALKLVHGARGQLPSVGTQGLTVVAENPLYIEGNYNACTAGNAPGTCTEPGGAFGPVGNGHVSAAVIADAVTLLSSAWNDMGSFIGSTTDGPTPRMPPHKIGASYPNTADGQVRQAATTWYRVGVIAGKGLNFTRPAGNAGDHGDFGTDGGAHNFLRMLENWGGQWLHYRGSMISFFTSRQAVGTYKCCDVVYGAPSRGYNFDTEFLNPALLPPRTPMFRDVNTLTFRQLLRPTQ